MLYKNMLNQMGMPGMGKNGKVNMGAMRGKLNQNMRGATLLPIVHGGELAVRQLV